MRTLRTCTTEGKSALCFYFRKLPNRGYSFVNNSIGYKPADKSLRLSGEKFDTEFIPLGKNKKNAPAIVVEADIENVSSRRKDGFFLSCF